MEQALSNIQRNRWENFVDYLLPVSVFSGSFISLVLCFYGYPVFGNHETFRLIVSGGLNGLIMLVLFIHFVTVLRQCKEKKKLLAPFCFLIILGLLSLIAWIKYAFSPFFLFQIAQFIVFGMQMYLTATIVVYEQKLKKFIYYFNYYGMILIPFCIFYLLRFFIGENTEQNPVNCFAGMSYMTLAYTFLPIIVVMISQYYFFDASDKKNKKFHLICIFLFWALIVFSGTRSAVICVIFLFIFLSIFSVVRGEKKNLKSIAMIAIIFGGMYFLSVYIIIPNATGSEGRMSNFNYDSDLYQKEKEHAILAYEDGELKDIHIQGFYINYLVNNNQTAKHSLDELHNNYKDGKEILIFEDKNDEKIFKNYEVYFGRSLLFELSIRESLKSIVIGNGTNYYQHKYENYPHNSFLEVLCDFGIVGLLLFLGILILVLIKVIPIGCKVLEVGIVLLLCFTWIPITCLSGTFYLNYNLIFSLVFASMCILFKDNFYKQGNEYENKEIH